MSHDPFDLLAEHDPMSADATPTPSGLAKRIMDEHPRRWFSSPWPGWVMAVAASILVAVAGGAWLLWLTPEDEPQVAATTSTSVAVSTTAATTTTSVVATTTLPVATTRPPRPTSSTRVDAVVYLLVDEVGPVTAPGLTLIPVAREVDASDTFYATIASLLAGPTISEAVGVPAFSSHIPADVGINDVRLEGNRLTADLSARFLANDPSLTLRRRTAQLLFTMLRFQDVERARVLIGGEPITLPGVDAAIVRATDVAGQFDDLMGGISIDSPSHAGMAGNPLMASGTANVFEATVSLALTDSQGLIIWEGFTTATCGTGCRGDWAHTIRYDVAGPQWGSLIAWESSAQDGSQVNVREHRVWLEPAPPNGGLQGQCSAAGLVGPGPQGGLTPEVAAVRDTMYNLAAACNLDLLVFSTADGFTFSFGGEEDPVVHWAEAENRGEEPTRFLAETLDLPHATIDIGGETLYVWPSVFTYDSWDEVPDKERDALRPLYGDEDFTDFEGFGAFTGYRITITADGEWTVFVAGD